MKDSQNWRGGERGHIPFVHDGGRGWGGNNLPPLAGSEPVAQHSRHAILWPWAEGGLCNSKLNSTFYRHFLLEGLPFSTHVKKRGVKTNR